MNILFLCTANIQRSRTAENLFKALDKKNTYKSAGLSAKYCEKYGTTLCTIEMLEGADKIFVMEKVHLERIKEYAGEQYLANVLVLGIEDKYQYMQEELVELLKRKLAGLI